MHRLTHLLTAAVLGAGTLLQTPALLAEVVQRQGALVTVVEEGRGEVDASATAPGAAAVKELAKQDAVRKAIELAVGVHITVKSTIRNFELDEDTVGAYSRVYIRSIRELDYTYDAPRRTGVYKGEFVIDGSTMAGLAEAERALSDQRHQPVQASVFFFDGLGRMIQDDMAVRVGDRFNVMVQPAGDLYAYIIGRDSRGNLFTVFPNAEVSTHQNPLRADVQYYFPPRKSELIFAFDDNPGQETFYFLLSAAPLADMDALFARLRELHTPEARRELTPIIRERIATRGFSLQSKPAQGGLVLPDEKVEHAVGELLQGTGALVKTVSLRHLP